MATHKTVVGALVAAAVALATGATGCEVIADFDRGKLLVDAGDLDANGPSDATVTDANDGSPLPDTGTDSDAAAESGTDAAADSASDSATDAADAADAAKDAGPVCAAGGASCGAPADCAAQTTVCISSTCAANCCGTSYEPVRTACADNHGKLCDGAGTCVACMLPSDCTAPSTLCKVSTCNAAAHTCGTANAAKGTACTDSGGVVCDGSGACVASHCNDGLMDADETDVDCGGSCGATCKDTAPQQKCKAGGDCISHVCSGTPLLCQPPTCTDGVKNGTETATDCGGPACDGLGKTCAPGQACGVQNDCTNASGCAGATYTSPATCPANVCVAGTQTNCAVSSKVCNASSGCVQCNTNGDCAAASCVGTTYTAASTCNAGNACVPGTTTSCGATGMVCDVASGCVACNAPSDCPATGNVCVVATCNGHACGTTNVTAGVSPPGLAQTPGDCQKLVCNGAGSVTSVDDGTDLPVSSTACLTNAACTGVPLTPSFTTAPTGTDCTSDNQPPKHLCGDTASVFAGVCVECNVAGDCTGGKTCSPAHACQ